MLRPCKVRRNTNNRQIEQVVIERPFTDERANVIYNYFRSIGIPIHLEAQAMQEELLRRGYNVDFDENAVTIEEQIQFLSTPQGEVYGFVTPEGEMFLDPEIAGVNTLIHEGAHIQYKVLKTATERGDFKAQAILTKIKEITNPVVESIFNAKKAQERGLDSMSYVDMQAEQSITKKMPELTELADKNIQIIKDYDRYQRILQKQAEGKRVLKTDRAFLDSHPELKNTPILDFGTPSDILKSVGITNPIKVSMSHINRKLVGKEAHELTLLDLQDLMRAIHNPATVNKGVKGRVQLLTNHTNSNKAPIVVVLDNNFKTNTASITTAYALNNLAKVVPETPQDVLYTNNKKLADFLSDYSESKNRGFGIALFAYPEYDSSTGTIKYTQEKTNPEIEFDIANIRKIIENTKSVINKTNVSRVDFQIIGEQGTQRVQEYADSLSKAKELEQEGIPYDQIETQTGNRIYLEHTPENALQMMRSTPIRAGESFSTGMAGAFRALFTPEFSSIQDIQANRDSIVSEQEFEQTRQAIDDEFYSLQKELEPYKIRPSSNILELMSTEALELYENGNSSGFNQLDPVLHDRFKNFVEILKTAPTEYFEAKPQRVVQIQEFSLALVPTGTSQVLKDRLIQTGLEVQEYSSEQDRKQKAKQYTQRNNLAFEAAELSSPVYNQRENETDAQYKERLQEEVFARALGDNAEQYLKDLGFTTQEAKTFLQKVQEFLAEIVDWLRGKKGLQDLSVDEINQLSIREFLDRSTTSMMLGEFKAQPQTAVQIAIQRNNGHPLHLAPNGKPSILYQSYRDLGYTEQQAEELTAQVYSDNFLNWFGDWINDPQNSSRVVDSNGQPMLMYHGSPSIDIEVFDRSKSKASSSGLKEFGDFFTSNRRLVNLYRTKELNKEAIEERNFQIRKYTELLHSARNIKDFDIYNNILNSLKEGRVYTTFLNIRTPLEGDAKGMDYDAWSYMKLDIRYKTARGRGEVLEAISGNNTAYDSPFDGALIHNMADMLSWGKDVSEYIGTVAMTLRPNQIKSATDNVGTFSSESNNINFQISGEQGAQVLEYQGSTLSYKQRVNPITNQPINQIEIDLISVPQENRNQGHARELLRRITEIADSRGQELYLFAAPRDRTTTTEGLIKLYKEFGFESISSFLPEEMVRPARRDSQRVEESLAPVETLYTEDIHGVQEYVPANSIITYYSEAGEINYKQNPDGSLTQLKIVSATPQQEESITYQQLLSIPNLSKEQALEAYKNLYSTKFYDWNNKTNECN